MASISGSVTIAGDPDDWIATAFDAETHAFAGVAAVSSGSYSISGLTTGKAYMVGCRPKTGNGWVANSGEYTTGDYCVPTDPATEPYIFKATDATPGDPYWDNVSLLMLMNGDDNGTVFTEAKGKTVTRYNAVTKTGTKKYGTASGYFDGSGDYLTLAGSSDFSFGTVDFTVEMWVYIPSGGSNTFPTLFDHRAASSSTALNIYTNSSRVALLQHQNNTLCQSAAMSADAWHHLALVRNGNDIRFYIDGDDVGGTAGDATGKSFGGTDTAFVGVSYALGGATYFYGYIDDLRITKGVARYTADFTPPASELLGYLSVPTGATEPTWPTTPGNTVVDGGVTWTNMGQLVQPLMQGPLIAA